MDFSQILLLLQIFALQSVNGKLHHQELNKSDVFHVQLGLMSEEITSKYFAKHSGSRCVLLITQDSAEIAKYLHQMPLFHINIPQTANKTPLEDQNYVKNFSQQILSGLNSVCLSFVIQVSKPDVITKIISHELRRSTQRENRKYLLIPSEIKQSDLKEEHKVFRQDSMAFMPDLVLATSTGTDRIVFQLSTHRFSGESSWEERVVLDEWSENVGFRKKANLFPDKTSNGMGKPLKYATFNYPPYSIVNLNTTPPTMDGTEVRLGAEFARKYNYTWTIVTDDAHEWGETWDNMTGNGILGNVVEDTADLGFGALYLWYNEYQRLDFSVPYIRTGITCLAPRPQPLPGWMAPILPFTGGMWAAVGVSLVVTTLALYLVTKASNKYLGRDHDIESRFTTLLACTLTSLALLLLQPPGGARNTSLAQAPNRHLLAWVLIVCLLVTSSYSSGLASMLTVPKFQRPIDTVSDLAASNIRWAATHEAWVFSIKEAVDPLTSHVYKQFRVMRSDELKKIAHLGHMAFSVERLPAGHYAVQEYLTQEAVQTLRLMKQDIYWEQCVTVTRKGSPYMPLLNKLIHRLLDSGILLHWEGEVVRKFLSSRVQSVVRNSAATPSGGPTKLQLTHVQGVFILLVFGLIVSLAVFVAEVTAIKCPDRRSGRKGTVVGRFDNELAGEGRAIKSPDRRSGRKGTVVDRFDKELAGEGRAIKSPNRRSGSKGTAIKCPDRRSGRKGTVVDMIDKELAGEGRAIKSPDRRLPHSALDRVKAEKYRDRRWKCSTIAEDDVVDKGVGDEKVVGEGTAGKIPNRRMQHVVDGVIWRSSFRHERFYPFVN